MWSSGVAVALLALAACAPHVARSGPSTDDARIRRVENGLLTANVVRGAPAPFTMAERLRFYHVPGVSVAVVDSGRVVWARSWGEKEAGRGVLVDTTTIFQAASISKPVTAVAVMQLVEKGKLSLDTPVNDYLRSWKLPDNAFTRAQPVTLRRLLSHSAGTTVSGFPGYAPGVPVPTIVQVLNGGAPSNTPAVLVDTLPGALWRYSGGGYTITQQLLTDVTLRPFDALLREQVLDRVGMPRSAFAQPLPVERRREAATAHHRDGTPYPGSFITYPELAAAGLWTTPSDLARFGIEMQRALAGDTTRIVSPATARLMVARQSGSYGLGFSVEGAGDTLWFTHSGGNAGFQSMFVSSTGGRGAVVMTNSDRGGELAGDILRAISREYGWNTYRPRELDVVQLDAASLARFVGTYKAASVSPRNLPDVVIAFDGRQLKATVAPLDWDALPLRPTSPTNFFFLDNRADLAFERDASGTVVGVVLNGFGNPLRFVR